MRISWLTRLSYPFGGGPPRTVYPNLAEALAAFLASDPPVAAAYPGRGGLAASVSNGLADRDAPLPALTFVLAEGRPLRLPSGRPLLVIGFGSRRAEHVTVNFHSFAEGADAAERQGTLLKSRLLATPAYTPTPLLFADGTETGRFYSGPDSTVLDPDRSSSNKEVFMHTTAVTFTVARP